MRRNICVDYVCCGQLKKLQDVMFVEIVHISLTVLVVMMDD